MKMSDLELSLAFKEARKRWGEGAFAYHIDIDLRKKEAMCKVGIRGPNPIMGVGHTWDEAFENAK